MPLDAGIPAPDFSLPDETGTMRRLSDFRGRQLILYFYPEDDTPGCTKEACEFRDASKTFAKRDAVIVGISPDKAAAQEKFATKYSLPFTLVPDPDHTIAEAYGVWKEKSMYGRKYMGILRSHFVIDEQGNLADVQYNVKATDSAPKALASLG